MIWQRLKKKLNDPQLRPQVKKLLSVARAWSNFGIGSGGQMTQYVVTKILQSGQPSKRFFFYFQCGRWWPEYSQRFPSVPRQSDVVMVGITPPRQPAQYKQILWDQNLAEINGIGIKTQVDRQQKQPSTKLKAFNSGPQYSRNTFGHAFKQLNMLIRTAKRDVSDYQHLPADFRHPAFRLAHQRFVSQIVSSLTKDLCQDPIKVQFSPQTAKIFKVPISQSFKDITINDVYPNNKYPVQQGRFSIKKNGKTLLSVVGDRIMIGQGIPKDTLQVITIPLGNDYSFYSDMMVKFEKFVRQL